MTDMARQAGLAVDDCARVLVDGQLRSLSHPNIFAAGDIARAGFPVRPGCVSALPMGAHAGTNVARLLKGEELKPFKFGAVLRCISLGRRDGLVQFTDRDDQPRERVVTGRLAALTKRLICDGTYFVARNELRTGLRLLTWSQPERELAGQREADYFTTRGTERTEIFKA
jgi:NADH:ubiquinone reductase (H+-translocating)